MRFAKVLFFALFATAAPCGPNSIPTGHGFPVEESVMAKWRRGLDDQNQEVRAQALASLRLHGWHLLELLTADVSPTTHRPRWYTWCTGYEVFDLATRCGTKLSRDPDDGVRGRGARPVSGAPLGIISDVYLNPELVTYLQKPGPQLRSLRKAEAGMLTLLQAQAQLPDPPRNAIAVKASWKHVVCPVKEAPAPFIDVWNGGPLDETLPADSVDSEGRLNGEKYLRYYIRPESLRYGKCKPDGTVTIPAGIPESRILSRDDLFWFQAREKRSVQAGYAYDLTPGDFLFNVGLHIVTREQKDWLWSTFWFDPRRGGRFADGRKNLSSAKARNFLMNITLRSSDVILNPYLEGPKFHGATSNCMHCHAQASVRLKSSNSGIEKFAQAPGTSGTTPLVPGGYTSTDFMWTLAFKASH